MPVTQIFKTEKELQDAIRAEELKHTVRLVKQRQRQIASNEEGLYHMACITVQGLVLTTTTEHSWDSHK